MSLEIHQNIKQKLHYFNKIHKIPNIIFHGPSGSGKKTIVNEFINVFKNELFLKIKSTSCFIKF